MSAPFSNRKEFEVVCDLSDLSPDLRRMLSIQFREFIHHIEDAEPDSVLEHSPRVIKFLERCYTDAA